MLGFGHTGLCSYMKAQVEKHKLQHFTPSHTQQNNQYFAQQTTPSPGLYQSNTTALVWKHFIWICVRWHSWQIYHINIKPIILIQGSLGSFTLFIVSRLYTAIQNYTLTMCTVFMFLFLQRDLLFIFIMSSFKRQKTSYSLLTSVIFT